MLQFSRIQNLHISQTFIPPQFIYNKFSRIQNLNISQTEDYMQHLSIGLVEFKIYISLKQKVLLFFKILRLVEFKIYISLKHIYKTLIFYHSLVEFKIYISLKHMVGVLMCKKV